MKGEFSTAVIFLLISLAFSQEEEDVKPKVQPKIQDYQESVKVNSAYPESKVTITVGDKQGFSYRVNGITNSVSKIAVSGEYFNDEVNYYGYARLFLVVDTGVAYYALRPHGNVLDVYVENYAYDKFYFEIITPRPVSAYDLNEGQINQTAVLITGPSRSAILHPRLKSVKNNYSRKNKFANKPNDAKKYDSNAEGSPVSVAPSK